MNPVLVQGLSPARQVLDNGAVVIVQETPTTPAVTILATFMAGSVYDPDDLPGTAWLTGLVLDRGTERRSGEQLSEALDDRGVALQVTTGRHTLSIGCTCLTEDFEDVLAIVLDVARRPVFPESELAIRRAELVTALRQDDDNPAAVAGTALAEILYGEHHPYGRQSTGTVSSVSRIRREDLVALHRRRFVPACLTLTVVGAVAEDLAVARAAVELDGWRAGAEEDVFVPPPPPPRGRRQRVVSMPGKSQTDIAYGFTAIRRLDPRYDAYALMNNVLGQFGLGGRLADNIRERQGMAYYAFSMFEPSAAEGSLVIRAGVDPSNVSRALAAIDLEVRRLADGGPSAAELEASRRYLIGSVARMLETNDSIAAFLQSAEQFGLGLDYDRRLPDHLGGVTIDDVARAAAEVLDPDAAAVAIAGPGMRGQGCG